MGNFLPIASREAESENQNHMTFVKDHVGLVSEESNGKDLGNEKKAWGVGEIGAVSTESFFCQIFCFQDIDNVISVPLILMFKATRSYVLVYKYLKRKKNYGVMRTRSFLHFCLI